MIMLKNIFYLFNFRSKCIDECIKSAVPVWKFRFGHTAKYDGDNERSGSQLGKGKGLHEFWYIKVSFVLRI